MKPRGNKRVKPQKETKTMTEQSTNEGQQVQAQEAVLEPQEGNETPGNLEPENEPESLQNLESNGGEKGPNPASDDGLEAALKESQDGAEKEGVRCTTDEAPELEHVLGSSELKNRADVVIEDGKVTKSRSPIETLQAAYGNMKFTESPDEAWITKDGITKVLQAYGLGVQPDGSKGYVVKVEEGYWGAVEDWAQGDGISTEDWLRNILYAAISTHGEPAKGR
jgi:hypothetical protein